MNDLFDAEPAGSPLAAGVIMDELAALGVTDIVCCPGSRSAPLAYAAAALEADGRARLHMRLDERGAGFTALGIAKATGRAVVVITTSGTAAANLAPAMAEARHARVPLIALTADRPSTLVGTRANQTADQVGLFGPVPLLSARVSAADAAPGAWRALVRRCVVTAEGRLTCRPGPVHVNAELSPPLVGEPGPVPPGSVFRAEPVDPGRAVRLDPGPRTVIVAGDMGGEAGRMWAEEAARAQVPLLAEPSSNARRGPAAIAGYRYLLPAASGQIERVVVAGHPTLSRPVTALLSRGDIQIVAVDPAGEWPDPGWAVNQVVPQAQLGLSDPDWLRTWQAADRHLRAAIDAEPVWSGEALAAAVWGSLGDQDALVLAASNPVRDADLAPVTPRPPVVFANRGLAGIDGTIATAAGVAIGRGRGVVALVGDLAFLHDVSSLAVPALEADVPLTVVVADDRGGSLFASLEYGAPRSQIGDLADQFERLFALPMGAEVPRVAAGFGLTVTSVADQAGLKRALAQTQRGIRVVHVPLDRADRARRDRELAAWGRSAVREVFLRK